MWIFYLLLILTPYTLYKYLYTYCLLKEQPLVPPCWVVNLLLTPYTLYISIYLPSARRATSGSSTEVGIFTEFHPSLGTPAFLNKNLPVNINVCTIKWVRSKVNYKTPCKVSLIYLNSKWRNLDITDTTNSQNNMAIFMH